MKSVFVFLSGIKRRAFAVASSIAKHRLGIAEPAGSIFASPLAPAGTLNEAVSQLGYS